MDGQPSHWVVKTAIESLARLTHRGAVAADGKTGWGEPVSKPGDYVVLRAVMDCVVAMSACPQDILPINKGKTVEAHYQILA